MHSNLLLRKPTDSKLYIEDVFSTYLYTGTGASQTITTGIDLSANSGMVWIKGRSGATDHAIYDTVRGVQKDLVTNSTAAQTTQSTGLTAFGSTGFTIGALAKLNTSAATYSAWTFRKAPKFFDIVTFTQTGGNMTIPHNLGIAPGMIILKNAGQQQNWFVWHRTGTNTSTKYLQLNTSDAVLTSASSMWFNTPDATNFYWNSGLYGNTTSQWVAYLFAHDTTSDGIVQCGAASTDGAGKASINLGWEAQFILYKNITSAADWALFDSVRGFPNIGAETIAPNTANAASGNDVAVPTSEGFEVNGIGASQSIVYVAIRRSPMRTQTDPTKLFQPIVYTGTNVDNRLIDTTIAPDMVMIRQRDDSVLGGMAIGDRLRGQPYLMTGTTAVEVSDADSLDKQIISTTEYGCSFSSMNGVYVGNDPSAKFNINTTANNQIIQAFKRSPGFFDIVCYTGTGSARTVSHNLGVAPELLIVKRRSGTADWQVYAGASGEYLVLNSSASKVSSNTDRWNNTAPTSTAFSLGTNAVVNASGGTYVAYLFATCAGVSKVGTYTGSGTTKQIDCGFTNGARFVLIKRTDSTGDWYVWDTARGIVSGNDPYLFLNSTAAEVTNTDYIDPYSAGFEISSTAPAAVNANGGTFVFLAIA